MSSIDPAARAASPSEIAKTLSRHAPLLFAITLFVSALLLFSVQPMFTKMVLPKLGGAPAIWSVAMVFFQGALLAGYAYAHWLSKLLPARSAALVHLGVLALAALTLPVGIAAGFSNPPSHNVEIWLLGLFAVSIGLPFTALAASAPLLQRWFAESGHAKAGNPYVLYAASNLGSFAALLAYPTLIEPFLTLRGQTATWAAGFGLLAVLIACAGLVVAARKTINPGTTRTVQADAPSLAKWLTWILLAAIPAGLVVAVTAHISTDIAASPFLWVIPLALYLLTFVAVFRERPWIPHDLAVRLMPYVIAPLAISMIGGDSAFWAVTVGLHLVAFFLITLVCHGELYQRRPDPARLTDFYLATSVGGVAGGIFTGLIAPNVFSNTIEYPILVAASVLALPYAFVGGASNTLRQMFPGLVLAAVIAALSYVSGLRLSADWMIVFQAVLIVLAGLMLLQRREPARLFSLVVLAFVITAFWQPGHGIIETTRSFFGVHKVTETANGKYRVLFHGTTIHGADRIRDDKGNLITGRAEPLTYYYRGGAISQVVETTRASRGKLANVAAVGLGTGTLACYRNDGENWTFFEIDPEVVRLARDPARFRFLSSCAPGIPVVLGDARLTLLSSKTKYDLIIIDAFSSDAIPTHLLTREALRGYVDRLVPGGVVTMHISNRHLELARLAAAVGEAEGLATLIKFDRNIENFDDEYKSNALVATFARSYDDLRELEKLGDWQRVKPDGVVPWTDDFSDLISALIRMKFAR